MEKRLKVSLYIRVSTDRQAKEGDSLEEQEKELKRFCELKGYTILRVHIEAGRSAKDTNRPEYQKLLRDIEAKNINAVIVKKLDRLSRSLMDFEKLMITLQDHNVEFISLKENFDTTTAMGKAMLRVALVFAQLEREQTAERISDVMNYRAEQGLRNGGQTPYGYDCINKELVPSRQHKKTLELIFEKFLETKSTIEVAKALNDLGTRNKAGKLWDCRAIHKILQNKTYIGKLLWDRTVHQGIHQPLISEGKFEQVRYLLSHKKYDTTRSKSQAVLPRILFCGECGRPMTPCHAYNRTKTKYYYYRCTSTSNSSGRKKANCPIKYAPLEKTEQRVIQILLDLSQEQFFKTIENKILKHNQLIERSAGGLKDDLTALENQLQSTKTKKDHYLDTLIAAKYLSAERERINEKLQELDLEEKQTKALIYKQQFDYAQKQEEQVDLSSFKNYLVTFRKDYESFSQQQLREFLVSTILEIIYHPDKLSVRFRALPWPLDFTAPA
jgi:site-specific DNA recombinase